MILLLARLERRGRAASLIRSAWHLLRPGSIVPGVMAIVTKLGRTLAGQDVYRAAIMTPGAVECEPFQMCAKAPVRASHATSICSKVPAVREICHAKGAGQAAGE